MLCPRNGYLNNFQANCDTGECIINVAGIYIIVTVLNGTENC